MVRRTLTYAAVVLLAGAVVFADRLFWTQAAIGIAISAVLALAWDILSRTGQVSLGTTPFFGLGAYSTSWLNPCSGWRPRGAGSCSLFWCRCAG